MADIFQSFCSFIQQEFFSSEAVGEEVLFAVDKYTIQKFCDNNGVEELELLKAIRNNLWKYNPSQSHVFGILAIQLYAASLRKEDNLYTAVNYRQRLYELLFWDDSDYNSWMPYYQDKYWRLFYDWCEEKGFYVQRCWPYEGKNRYVQYPLKHSESVFTTEDLLYIAKSFVDNNLLPGEDVSYNEFIRIIKDYTVRYSIQTSHGRGVIDCSRSKDDYLRQVYNYYLRWDGLYKEGYTQKRVNKQKESIERQLYMTEDLNVLEFRTKDMVLIEPRFDIDGLTYESIKNKYSFRRKNTSVIIFKKDDVYDNYWQETRFLERGSEGLAMVFKQRTALYYPQEKIKKQSKTIVIIKITKDYDPFDCYAEEKPFSIEGGLKIDRDTYLLGAGPKVKVLKNVPFWINGEKHKGKGEYPISGIGKNTVKFRDYKSIEIYIANHIEQKHIWSDNYTKWNLDKKTEKWEPSKNDGTIVGLDFSPMCSVVETTDGVLTRWANFHLLKARTNNEQNIAITQLINSDYEY